MIEVKMAQAISMMAKYLLCGLVPLLTSGPGIGKSQGVYKVAEQYNLKVIDLRIAQSDPTDMNGFPYVQNGKATYIPMDTFPLEGDPIPEGYSGWLIFFDELTSGAKAVQAASYKIILDRMIGQEKLHKNVAMVAAGNRSTDNAIVEEMSTALISRLVHIHVKVDKDEFVNWCGANGIDHRITSFVNFKPTNVYTFNPDNTDETYSCPRTLEFADRILKKVDLKDPDFLPMLAGALSEGVARELTVFCKIHESLPKVVDILSNPSGAKVPEERSILYALSGAIAHNATEGNIDRVMQFVNRIDKDFQIVTLRETVARNPKLRKSAAVQEWVDQNADAFF